MGEFVGQAHNDFQKLFAYHYPLLLSTKLLRTQAWVRGVMDMMGITSSQPALSGDTQHLNIDQAVQDDAHEVASHSYQALVDSQLTSQLTPADPVVTPQRDPHDERRKTGSRSRSSRKTKTYSKKNRKVAVPEPEPESASEPEPSPDNDNDNDSDSEVEPEPVRKSQKVPIREPSMELGDPLPPPRATIARLPPVPESPAADAGSQQSDISVEASVPMKKSKKRKRKQESKDSRKSSRRHRNESPEFHAEEDQNMVADSQKQPVVDKDGVDEAISEEERVVPELVEEEQDEAEQDMVEQEEGNLDEEELLQAQLRVQEGGEDGEQMEVERAQHDDDEEEQVDEEQMEEEGVEGALDDQLPTPPKSEQIALQNQQEERQGSSQSRVASWLEEHPEDPEEMVVPNGRTQHSRAASIPEDDDDNVENYDAPPDPENGYEEEISQRNSAKAKGKRKRASSGRVSAGPSKKRAKASDLTVQADGDDGDGSAKTPASRQRGDRAAFPTSGPFTSAEIEIVESTFEEKREEWNLTQPEMNEKIYNSSKSDVGLVLTELGGVLINRNRKAIQRFCRRHYNNYQRGKWTDDQDELLRNAYAENPNRWTYIGGRVGRMPEDCRDRWRNHLSHGDARHIDVWTESEEFNLVKAIKECLDAVKHKGGVEINHDNEDDYIAWQVVVQKLNNTRNRLQCSQKWKKIKARVEKEENLQGAKAPGQNGSPERMSTAKAAAKRRYKNMVPGDIYQILQEIQYGAMMGTFSNQETFWAVVTRLHSTSPWNTQDRKHVYKQLKKNNISDEGNVSSNIDLLIKWCEGMFTPEVLAKRSTQPANRHRKDGAIRRKVSSRFISNERVVDDAEDSETDNAGDATAADELNGEDAKVAAHNIVEEEEVRSVVSTSATPDNQDVEEMPESVHTPIPQTEVEHYREPSPHVSESEYSDM